MDNKKHTVKLIDSNNSVVRIFETDNKEDADLKARLWKTLFRYNKVVLDNELY